MSGFERRDGVLLCDGVSLEEAAGRFGTPLYVYSRAAVVEAFEAYDHAFDGVSHRVCYALKANSSGALLRLLAGLGAGADVVSGFELQAARRAGFPAERIVFAGVGKTQAEIAEGIAEGIAEFNAESEQEIIHIAATAAAAGKRASVALRVNPDIDARSHPYISTGLRENKFGVDIRLAPEILGRCRSLPGLEIAGLQAHIGSQIMDLEPLEETATELCALSRQLLDDGFPLKTIDVGGGLGIGYLGQPTPEPADLAARLVPRLQGLPLTLLLEPGRWLVGRAGVLLTRVLYLKQNRGKTFVVVDAGMNDLVRPSLYEAYHRIEPVVSRARGPLLVDIVGPVCETGDFLARERDIEHVEPGELLAVRDAGAYGYCMTSNYNMRPRPAEALVEAGEARLVRRRETFDDLLGTEVDSSSGP